MNLDFRKCKTPADIKKVFDKKKKEFKAIKKITQQVRKGER